MKTLRIRSNEGFSLVELMVVVAIIGILAAISVGQVNKQIAKSRQSEAKTNLSSLYTAEKALYAEFAGYSTSFTQTAFGVEGNARYNLGFSAASGLNAASGYTGADPNGTGPMNLTTFCNAAPQPCKIIQTNGKSPVGVANATVNNGANPAQFTAAANAFIYQGNMTDVWSINQNKQITNTTPGIP